MSTTNVLERWHSAMNHADALYCWLGAASDHRDRALEGRIQKKIAAADARVIALQTAVPDDDIRTLAVIVARHMPWLADSDPHMSRQNVACSNLVHACIDSADRWEVFRLADAALAADPELSEDSDYYSDYIDMGALVRLVQACLALRHAA